MLMRPPPLAEQKDNLSHVHTQSDAQQSSKSKNKIKKKQNSLSFRNKPLNNSRQNQQKQKEADNVSVNSHASGRSKKSKKKQSSLGFNKPRGGYITANSPRKSNQEDIQVMDYAEIAQRPETKNNYYQIQQSQVKRDYVPADLSYSPQIRENKSPNIIDNPNNNAKKYNSFKDVTSNFEYQYQKKSSPKDEDDEIPVVKLIEGTNNKQQFNQKNNINNMVSPKVAQKKQTKKLGQLFEENRKTHQYSTELGISAVPSEIGNSSLMGGQSRRSRSKLGQLFKQKSKQKQMNNSSRVSFTQNASSNYNESISDLHLQLNSHVEGPRINQFGNRSKQKQNIQKGSIPEKVLQESVHQFSVGEDTNNKSQLNLSVSRNSPFTSHLQQQIGTVNNKDSVCFNLEPQRQKRKKGLGLASKMMKQQDQIIKISGNLMSKDISPLQSQQNKNLYSQQSRNQQNISPHQRLKNNFRQNEKYLQQSGAMNYYDSVQAKSRQQQQLRRKQQQKKIRQKQIEIQKSIAAQKSRQQAQRKKQQQERIQQEKFEKEQQKLRIQTEKRKQQQIKQQNQRRRQQQQYILIQQQQLKKEKQFQIQKQKQIQKQRIKQAEQQQKRLQQKQRQKQKQKQREKQRQRQQQKRQRQVQKQRLKQKQREQKQRQQLQLQIKRQKQRLKQQQKQQFQRQKQKTKLVYKKKQQIIRNNTESASEKQSLIYELGDSEVNSQAPSKNQIRLSKLPSTYSRDNSERQSSKSQQSRKSTRKKEGVIARNDRKHFLAQASPRAQQSFYQERQQKNTNKFTQQKVQLNEQPRKLMSFDLQDEINYEPKNKTDTYFYDKSSKAYSKPPLSKKSSSKSKPKEGLINKKTSKDSTVQINQSGNQNKPAGKKLTLVELAMKKNYEPQSGSQYQSQDSFRSRENSANSSGSKNSRNSLNSRGSRKKQSTIKLKQNTLTNRPPLYRKNSSQIEDNIINRAAKHERQIQQQQRLNYAEIERQSKPTVIKGCSFIDQKGRLVQNGNMIVRGSQVTSVVSRTGGLTEQKFIERLKNSRQKRRSTSRQRSLNRSRASSRSNEKGDSRYQTGNNNSRYNTNNSNNHYAQSQAYSEAQQSQSRRYENTGNSFYNSRNGSSFYQNNNATGSRANYGNTNNYRQTPQHLQQFIKPIEETANINKNRQYQNTNQFNQQNQKKRTMQRTQKVTSRGKY